MYSHGKFISKFLSFHCFTVCIAIIFIFFITNKGYSQSKNNSNPDTTIKIVSITDSTGNKVRDSIALKNNASDTSKLKRLEAELGIRISKDALTSVIKAEARDSEIVDMRTNTSYLFGKVQVNYEDLQLNHGEVVYNQSSNMVLAAPQEGSTDTSALRGSFVQGKEKFTLDSIRYNFKSKRAIVTNVQTQYGEGFMHSEQIKRNPDQVIYGSRSVYTTCALDTPHFGIVLHRFKIIPNKLIASGPANFTVMGVPTPLWLPFGLFPISQTQKSGFILPTYTIEEQRGFGLLNGGYYFYLSDNADLKLQTNFYTKGSYAFTALSTYNDIYHYNGGFNLSYAFNKTGENFEPGASITKDFMINWRHNSDAKAVPGQTFNASVQVGTSSYYSNNSYDPNQILQNQYQSNITYSKTWQGQPFGLTLSALHSQNTATKQINVTLPAFNFHVTQFNPLQRKKSIGTHWYDKLTTSYTMDMLNRTTFYDSTFNPSNISLRDFHSGIHQNVPISASYTVLRFINMSFNVGYNEYWLNERETMAYNDAEKKIDTTDQYGFYTARDFSAGVSFSTRIYGMKMFKHGKLRGIRHVITPTFGLSYHPDFGAAPFNYYYKTRLDSTQTTTLLSPYATSIIGLPPSGRSGLINMGIGNNLQIKVRSSKDTVTGYKNVTIIDGFSINTSYNMAVDSFQWSLIGVSFRTNVLDKVNISSSASFDPYSTDYNTGRRLPQTMIDLGEGIARFTSASFSLGSNFHSKPPSGPNSPTNSQEYARIMRNAGYNEYVDFNIPWSFNVNYSLNASNTYNPSSHSDTLVTTHNATFQGELKLTARWKMSVNSGYNFTQHQLAFTSIDVFRDLHCFAMHFQAIPFGPRKSYNFTINAKASVLQDLKIQRRRDFRDTAF